MKEIVVGVDVGGRGSTIAFTSLNEGIIIRTTIPTLTDQKAEIFIELLADTIKSTFDEFTNLNEQHVLKGIGIGAPDANCLTGVIEHAPNLGWGDHVPFVDIMRQHFSSDIVIVLSNDANAAAVGEKVFGAARDFSNFIEITLGTGLGSGIYINNQLITGSRGFAGELGHVNVVPNGRVCGCGRKGCLESYCSASGIERTALELMSYRKDDSLLRSVAPNDLTSKAIYGAAVKGDSIAIETFNKTGDMLGRALADFATFSDPEAFILFGGPTQAGELLLAPTREGLKNIMPMYKGIKLLVSELEGADAALLGSAATVWDILKA